MCLWACCGRVFGLVGGEKGPVLSSFLFVRAEVFWSVNSGVPYGRNASILFTADVSAVSQLWAVHLVPTGFFFVDEWWFVSWSNRAWRRVVKGRLLGYWAVVGLLLARGDSRREDYVFISLMGWVGAADFRAACVFCFITFSSGRRWDE